MSRFYKFNVGEVFTNMDVTRGFKCANMGGMRRSKRTNSLVLIADHTKGLYKDKWDNGVLNYTGMGKIGDQELNFSQNRTLAESNLNGVEVHLFEVLVKTEYIYRGQVFLAREPYQEIQKDDKGNLRKVWMFPLKLKENN